MADRRFEPLGGGVSACVSKAHTFGTDALLLSEFAAAKPRERCLDLCAGCGIVPLLWFRTPEAPREAFACDIQPLAVEQMQAACVHSGLEGRFFPVLADLREPRGVFEHASFDLVTCNPPYQKQGTGMPSALESDLLARHETACTLEDVLKSAAWLLRFGGRLCVCYPPQRLCDLLSLMRAHRLEPKRLRFVQQRADSAPWLVLAQGRLGGAPGLVLEAPLILEEEYGRAPGARRAYGDFS